MYFNIRQIIISFFVYLIQAFSYVIFTEPMKCSHADEFEIWEDIYSY